MTLAYKGPWADTPADVAAAILDRATSFEGFVDAVRPIRDAIRVDGDDALRRFTEKFDGATVDALDVPRDEWDAALARIPADVVDALREARRNLARFHEAQRPHGMDVEVVPGLRAGRRVVPLARVGAYAPGGRASYPSTVLMTVTPAKVAGVPEVVVATPPGPDGRIPDVTLAACAIAGADRVIRVGGAQAVFALAEGTETVPRVDKIVGPGNAYVAAAKSLVAGRVATDAPAGPSEVLVLHDGPWEATWPRFAAAELVAQAEHDPEAAVALATTDPAFADATVAAVDAELADAPRADVIREALGKRGAVVTVPDRDALVKFADAYAPEHLALMVEATGDASPARALLDDISNYGSAFLGPWSTVALGDYCAGPNHVLPTMGLARASSGLSVDDFVKRPTHQTADPAALRALGAVASRLAAFEGLPAHAAAVDRRVAALDDEKRGDGK